MKLWHAFSTTMGHMPKNMVICAVHAVLLFIKQHGCVQSTYLTNNPYTYIYTCIPRIHKRVTKNDTMWNTS